MRLRMSLLLLALSIALIAPGAAIAGSPLLGDGPTGGTPGTDATGGMEHVANIPFPGTPFNGGGSDVEFTTKTVVKLDGGATGDPVCTEDAEQPDGCARDENGEIVYEVEDRDFAIAGRLSQNSFVIDITDPREPVKVSEIPCALYQNDVQIQGDIAIVARDDFDGQTCRRPDGSTLFNVNGFATVDISDPRNPVVLGRAQITRGAHNVTAHPTEPLIYVSNSDLGIEGVGRQDATIHIWDISDPATPTLVQDWTYGPVHSPHDITFNAEGTRAYAASVSHTDIINTENPREPELISTWVDPTMQISHQADPTPDGNYLIVTDEAGGGLWPQCPGGVVHIWDISNENVPIKVGIFGADEVGIATTSLACTAHVFRINPDGRTMAIAWYNAGTYVVDFSHIIGAGYGGTGALTGRAPTTIASMKMPDADTWASKMWMERHPGYVFATDMNRGFDVFFVPSMRTPIVQEPPVGGLMSDNVRYVGTIPDTPGIGARVLKVGDQTRFYFTGSQGLSIYDISNPRVPILMGKLLLPHFQNEAVSVADDGSRAIIATDTATLDTREPPSDPTQASNASNGIRIIDTSDPHNPTLVGSVHAGSEHTATCADAKCEWIYGSSGRIYDARNPANPVYIGKVWRSGGGHALYRDKAGLMISDSNPRLLLDVSDPANPVEIARSGNVPNDGFLQHNNVRPLADEWVPREEGDDDPALRPGELFIGNSESNVVPRCTASSGGLTTWSMKDFDKQPEGGGPNVKLQRLHSFRPVNGTYVGNGDPAVNALGCSGHWFTEHDNYVTAAWYEHGVKFFEIDPADGRITQRGYFQPVATESGSAHWVVDGAGNMYVYTTDYARGIDILKFDPDAAPPSEDELYDSWAWNLENLRANGPGTMSAAERFVCRIAMHGGVTVG